MIRPSILHLAFYQKLALKVGIASRRKSVVVFSCSLFVRCSMPLEQLVSKVLQVGKTWDEILHFWSAWWLNLVGHKYTDK